MSRLSKISFLLCSVVLSFCTVEISAADSIHDVVSEYQHQSNAPSSSVYPENGPDLYCIQRQGRSAVSLIQIPPAPGAKDNPQQDSFAGPHVEYAIPKLAAIYLEYFRKIDLSLTVRELLFPFHSFL